MHEPDWLQKAIADGSATVKGVNPSAFESPVLDRAPGTLKLFDHQFADLIALSTSEAEFQEWVVALAHQHGWSVVHIRKVLVKMGEKTHYETPFALDGVGSFDLDFYRERHFKAELKHGKNTPSAEQRAWGLRYDRAGVENYIWYPKDCEQIIKVITCHKPWTDSPSAKSTS